jgi:Predicted nucleotide kinase
MTLIFPAIAIGGPPHSGKSTLIYRLSNALRQKGIDHYVLRANPDGEGDWSYEADSNLVAVLRQRVKGPWNDEFTQHVMRSIQQRHLPLLVDLGGKITSETKKVASQCTHAIVLSRDSELLSAWRTCMEDCSLQLVAELLSVLEGEQSGSLETMPIQAVISGLSQDKSSDGPVFKALVEVVSHSISYTSEEIYRIHSALAPSDCIINVSQAIYPLPRSAGEPWLPEYLRPLLDSLPRDEALCVYGRGPIWLYAALAGHTLELPFYLFDPRYGWITPPSTRRLSKAQDPRLHWQISEGKAYQRLSIDIVDNFLDYHEADDLLLPSFPPEVGLVFDGKLPNWMYTALVRSYSSQAWLALFQPQRSEAIVVYSNDPAIALGQTIQL